MVTADKKQTNQEKMNYIQLNTSLKGERVKIFRNLRSKKSPLWSVLDLRGKLLGHCRSIMLENTDFKVSEKKRLWVVKNNRKVPHAFIIGDVVNFSDQYHYFSSLKERISYNPYASNLFYYCKTNEPIEKAKLVDAIANQGVFIKN